MQKKIINHMVLLFLFTFMLSSCAIQYVPVSDNSPINSMISGGKSDAMKFSTSADNNQINLNNPKIKSIVRVAKQNTSAKVIILYPPNNVNLAEKLYSVLKQANLGVMRPIQSAVVSNGISDNKNIYVYVTFSPILNAHNFVESAYAK